MQSTFALSRLGSNSLFNKKSNGSNLLRHATIKSTSRMKSFENFSDSFAMSFGVALFGCPASYQPNQWLHIEEFFQRIKKLQWIVMLLTLATFILTVMHYDIEFDEENSVLSNRLSWIIFICSVILGIFIFLQQILRFKYLKIRGDYYAEETIFSSGIWKHIFIEIVIGLIHPSPFLLGKKIEFHLTQSINNTKVTGVFYYNANNIFHYLVLLKLLFIIKTILLGTMWMSNRASRICYIYNCQSSFTFAIKALYRIKPIQFVACVLIGGLGIFAYAIRICEGPVVGGSNYSNLHLYENSIWLVISTLTSIGYGDFSPKTVFGKITAVICSLCGATILSVMIVTIHNYTQLEPFEQRAYIVLKKLKKKVKLRESAAFIMTILHKLHNKKKRNRKVFAIKKRLRTFKRDLNEYKVIQENNPSENFMNFMLITKNEIKSIEENQKNIAMAMDIIGGVMKNDSDFALFSINKNESPIVDAPYYFVSPKISGIETNESNTKNNTRVRFSDIEL